VSWRCNGKLLLVAVCALGVSALAFACSGDGERSGADVDRAYVRTWCLALATFRDDVLGSDKQGTPYPVRNIAANEHFLDTMSKAEPPEDVQDWHNEWIAAGRANLEKLRANDPSAAPDPMDVGPEAPLAERIVALFAELPECAIATPSAPQPSPSGGPSGNGHSNASAVQIAPGEVHVSFDYTYTMDPQGSAITMITVTPFGASGQPLEGYSPRVIPISRGSGHEDLIMDFSTAQLASVTGFAICFAGPYAPDLGCARLQYP
jgi:hypothetical protein